MEVGDEFSSTKALLHMLFHILGRYHEHKRADRDIYVDIRKRNIIEGIVVIHNTSIPYSSKILPSNFDTK